MTVAMHHIPHRLTWEAFIELPEELLRHAELHDGEVVEMASPDRPHQLTLVNLIMALGPWVREHSGELVPDPHVRIADYYHEWVDGESASSPLLPGFEVAVADVISQAS